MIEDYLPIHMKSTDVIIEIQWLFTLGVTKDDWRYLTMAFEVDGKAFTLKGDPTLCKSLVSLKTIIKDIQ